MMMKTRIAKGVVAVLVVTGWCCAQQPGGAEEDHRGMMKALGIETLRRGADGDPKSPNAANADEAKAGYRSLPDPLVFNGGGRVRSAEEWWSRRRPEIVEMFDREIYGRVPAGVPGVRWEEVSKVEERRGEVAV
jgi:hypothetical protein